MLIHLPSVGKQKKEEFKLAEDQEKKLDLSLETKKSKGSKGI